MAKFYVPSDVPEEYYYLGSLTNTYYDLYDKSNIQNTSGVYYRIYYAFDPSYWEARSYNYSQYNSTAFPVIETTNSVFARYDNYKIFSVSFVIIFLIILLCNIMTSIIKRGGVLGGLL